MVELEKVHAELKKAGCYLAPVVYTTSLWLPCKIQRSFRFLDLGLPSPGSPEISVLGSERGLGSCSPLLTWAKAEGQGGHLRRCPSGGRPSAAGPCQVQGAQAEPALWQVVLTVDDEIKSIDRAARLKMASRC